MNTKRQITRSLNTCGILYTETIFNVARDVISKWSFGAYVNLYVDPDRG